MSKVRMDWHCNGMLAAEKGGFVSYDDYAKLEARIRELEADIVYLKNIQAELVADRKKLEAENSSLFWEASALRGLDK